MYVTLFIVTLFIVTLFIVMLSVLDKEKGQLFVSDKSGATFTLSLDNHMVCLPLTHPVL